MHKLILIQTHILDKMMKTEAVFKSNTPEKEYCNLLAFLSPRDGTHTEKYTGLESLHRLCGLEIPHLLNRDGVNKAKH